ncbi:MAG: hypothetical protein U0805_02335 [Pirellulales bacterium]
MVTTSSRIHAQQRRPWAIRAALLLATLGPGACCGCNRSENHVAVHPVEGAIQFRGKPPEGAFVSLVPKDAKQGVPNPRATVAKDGSFAVTTYDGNDGAPEGEYVLTVQWYKPVRQGDELVGGPNALPVKYASARTSDITIRVAAGDNHLPPIQLR